MAEYKEEQYSTVSYFRFTRSRFNHVLTHGITACIHLSTVDSTGCGARWVRDSLEVSFKVVVLCLNFRRTCLHRR